MLGILRKPAWLAALCGLAAGCLWRWDCTYAGQHRVRGRDMAPRKRLFPIGWVVFTAVLLYRITQRDGKVRNQGLDWLAFPQSPPPGVADRFCFLRCIHRRSFGFWNADRCRRRNADRSGILSLLCRGDLSAGEYLPSGVRIDWHPDHYLAQVTELQCVLSAGVGRICAPLSLFVPSS